MGLVNGSDDHRRIYDFSWNSCVGFPHFEEQQIMSNALYASGKFAFGFCDRCGFRYSYNELQEQMIDANLSGLKVCPTCMDIDHEQLRLGETPILDPQALWEPRPDTSRQDSIDLFGWNPVGHPVTNEMTASVGTVTITLT